MPVARLVRRTLRSLLAPCVISAGVLSAQVPEVVDTSKKAQPLFTITDAALVAGFVGATVALFPLDKSMALRLQNEHAVATKTIDRWATAFDNITLPGVFIIGPAVYAFGRFGHHQGIEDLGWHTTEAALVGTAITGVLKDLFGRARPFVTGDTNPRDFRFGKGFGNDSRSSFPSGHATIAFAAAAAATSEVQREWPRYTWVVGPVLYGGATLVGLARMYGNQHWASDVVFGAGIGTLSGLKVVKYSHAHPDNFLDRIILHTVIAPTPGGGESVGWSFPMPRHTP